MERPAVLWALCGSVRNGLSHGESWPGNRTVLFREGKLTVGTGATDLLQQLFTRCVDNDWIAADPVHRLDLLIATQLCKDVAPPARICGQSQQAHKRRPRHISGMGLIIEHKGLTRTAVTMKRCRDGNEVP